MNTMGMMYHQRRAARVAVFMALLLSLLFLSQQVTDQNVW
jgi:hypothetical protein